MIFNVVHSSVLKRIHFCTTNNKNNGNDKSERKRERTNGISIKISFEKVELTFENAKACTNKPKAEKKLNPNRPYRMVTIVVKESTRCTKTIFFSLLIPICFLSISVPKTVRFCHFPTQKFSLLPRFRDSENIR